MGLVLVHRHHVQLVTTAPLALVHRHSVPLATTAPLELVQRPHALRVPIMEVTERQQVHSVPNALATITALQPQLHQYNVQVDGVVTLGQRWIKIHQRVMLRSGHAMDMRTRLKYGYQPGLVVGYIVKDTLVHGGIMQAILVEQTDRSPYMPRKTIPPFLTITNRVRAFDVHPIYNVYPAFSNPLFSMYYMVT